VQRKLAKKKGAPEMKTRAAAWVLLVACVGVFREATATAACPPGPGVADPVACTCFPGFGGAGCTLHEYKACNQRGVITRSGTCVCAQGFSGGFCEIRDVPEVRST